MTPRSLLAAYLSAMSLIAAALVLMHVSGGMS